MKLVLVLALYTSLWNVCQMENDNDALRVVRQGNWALTSSMYTTLSKATDGYGNVLFSPLSLQVILALTYTGAGGDTAKQISRGLRLPDRPDQIKSGFRQLLRLLLPGKKGNVTLETANKIFPSVEHPVLKSFNDSVGKYFAAEVENVDYGAPSRVAKAVNGWVTKKTHAKITEVVPEEGVDPSTKLLLINAVYFKGDWAVAFDKALTSVQPFRTAGDGVKDVEMMRLVGRFGYEEREDVGAVVLELPYKDEDTSLVVILPAHINGLPDVEAKLRKVGLDKVVGERKLTRKKLDLSFPKFNMKLSTSFNEVLQALGMVDMFGSKADLSKMSTEKGLYVSNVLHKTMIEVSEEGTEAAAVTSVEVMLRSAPLPPERVVVDRPFSFALVARRAGVVVFMGRYTGKEGGLSVEALRESTREGTGAKSSSSSLSTRCGGILTFLLSCAVFRRHADP